MDDNQKIAELREKGYSFGKIAKILGLSKQTVYNRYNNWLLQEERKKVKTLIEEYTRKLEELEQKEMELQEREKILEYREKSMEEREWEVEQKLAYLDSLKSEIEYLERRIKKKENEIQDLTREKLRLMDEIRERRVVLYQLPDPDRVRKVSGHCYELSFENFELGVKHVEDENRNQEDIHWGIYPLEDLKSVDVNREGKGNDIFDKWIKDWTLVD
jgi:transposase